MQKVDAKTWTKLCDLTREDIGEEHIKKLAKQKTATLICPHCVDVLMQKDKKELIEMLIDRAIPKVAPPTRY